eukprot:TRINITY_DN2080_c0_g1_i1.p1 TRINITY_DN2080_c0_g1~~TRINITY_DN2080_c0_g1_i1.p1  ORF type:complete len:928 (+),score=226.04 TRINITY_DN2080_c0_g1_i1:28-2784(+)
MAFATPVDADAAWRFADVDHDGQVGREDVVNLLKKSKLNQLALAQIWELSIGQKTMLSREDFVLLLRLVALAQTSKQISSQSLVAAGPLPAPQFEGFVHVDAWAVPQDQLVQYNAMFQQHRDTPAGLSRNLFLQSYDFRLPSGVCARLWDLADMDKDGCLNCYEFIVAMHALSMYTGRLCDVPHDVPVSLRASMPHATPPAPAASPNGSPHATLFPSSAVFDDAFSTPMRPSTAPSILRAGAGVPPTAVSPLGTPQTPLQVQRTVSGSFHEEFNTLSFNNAALQQEVSVSNLNMVRQQEEVSTITSIVEAERAKQATLKSSLDAARSQERELMQTVAALREEAQALKEQNDGMGLQGSAAAVRVADCEKEITALKAEVDKQKAQCQRVRADCAAREAEFSMKQDEMKNLQQLKKETEEQLEALTAKLSQATEKLETFETESDQTTKEVSAMKEQITTIRLKLPALTDQKKEQEKLLSDRKDTMTKEKETLLKLQKTLQRQKQQLDKVTEELEQVDARLAEAKLLQQQLTTEMANVQNRLAEAAARKTQSLGEAHKILEELVSKLKHHITGVTKAKEELLSSKGLKTLEKRHSVRMAAVTPPPLLSRPSEAVSDLSNSEPQQQPQLQQPLAAADEGRAKAPSAPPYTGVAAPAPLLDLNLPTNRGESIRRPAAVSLQRTSGTGGSAFSRVGSLGTLTSPRGSTGREALCPSPLSMSSGPVVAHPQPDSVPGWPAPEAVFGENFTATASIGIALPQTFAAEDRLGPLWPAFAVGAVRARGASLPALPLMHSAGLVGAQQPQLPQIQPQPQPQSQPQPQHLPPSTPTPPPSSSTPVQSPASTSSASSTPVAHCLRPPATRLPLRQPPAHLTHLRWWQRMYRRRARTLLGQWTPAQQILLPRRRLEAPLVHCFPLHLCLTNK